MSLTQRVKQGFLRLPLMKKAILTGSAALAVSTVLPWYDLRNSFGVGATYLGIQGPLFVIGLLVLGCGLVSFFNMFFPLMGRQFFNLRKRGGSTAMTLGGQALLLLLVANSIFYHPDFGAAVSSKATRFGMVLAFASIGLMIIAGWMARRKEDEENDNVEDVLEAAAPVTPVSTPSYSVPVTGMAARPTVDPLTLDARTRYKMMRSQGRYSSNAQNNLWGSGAGSAFGRAGSASDDNSDN
ncbi:hypothetical protein A2974_02150 [Candidatus Peregrinibacteria bacterium RIFCSPLOWO2_01_FULL_48_20]|nr:MAG: hypothetical protein A2974_02150 [Candidatus Peregrinibacteria bacterium RIFCSPLOWO2_01_FULL_48_20]